MSSGVRKTSPTKPMSSSAPKTTLGWRRSAQSRLLLRLLGPRSAREEEEALIAGGCAG